MKTKKQPRNETKIQKLFRLSLELKAKGITAAAAKRKRQFFDELNRALKS